MASSTSPRAPLAAAAASLVLLLSVAIPAVSAQRAAPNLTDILVKGGQYNTLLTLLTATNLTQQFPSLLNASREGLTVFAPTDSAFSALPPNALTSLTPRFQFSVLIYHVLPKFYTVEELRAATNPVTTAATLANQGGYTIEVIAGSSSQVNLSTGVVVVPVGMALNVTRPLAVYSLGSVLLPADIFGSNAPAPSPRGRPSAPSPSPVSGGPSAPSPRPVSDEPSAPSPRPVSGGPSPPGSGAAGGMIRAGGVLGWWTVVGVGVVSSLLAAV